MRTAGPRPTAHFDPLPTRELWAGGDCYAHTPGHSGHFHRFRDHALRVGALAKEFAEPFGGGSLAEFLGLTHDTGKLASEVQEALRERARDHGRHLGAKHKAEGAALALLWFGENNLRGVVGHLVNFGHHTGLPDLDSVTRPAINKLRNDASYLDSFGAKLSAEVGMDVRALADEVTVPAFLTESALGLDVFTRMVHSSLVDADFLDTAAHFAGDHEPRRHPGQGMPLLREAFMVAHAARFGSGANTEINELRRKVFDRCVAAGLDPRPVASRRIYRLAAQTGTGKTMAAAAFALNHAARFGKRRVIVAVPFTSITTQNAAEYRLAFGKLGAEVVLEHHSNIADDNDNTWRRLNAQNWDAEFIVTTTVQLLESLFSGKPGAARKLHRLVNSVVVIDEVQALPLLLVPAILSMLKELVANYGVTLLLASATQPTFWDLDVWRHLPEPHDILARDREPEVTRRVSYGFRQGEVTWEAIADDIAANGSALAIVNTTADAQTLHAALVQRVTDRQVLHLSTRMCSQHRSDVLAQVGSLLASGEPVVLVSTQLIEAGVDVDFPVVFRAMAPADSIVQSAGRCNREGLLGRLGGRVVVFESPGGHTPPGFYQQATQITRKLWSSGGWEFGEPAAMDTYYRELLRRRIEGSEISAKVESARRELNFPEVSHLFRMIDDRTQPVVVTAYGRDPGRRAVAALVEALDSDPGMALNPTQRSLLQLFSAAVPTRLVDQVATRTAGGVSVLTEGFYHPSCGVMLTTDASIW